MNKEQNAINVNANNLEEIKLENQPNNIENKISENEQIKKEYEEKMEKLTNELSELKKKNELEIKNWKARIYSILEKEWSRINTINPKIQWEEFDMSQLDFKNLNQSLVKYADENKLLKPKVESSENELFKQTKSSLFVDKDKGVVF